LAPFADYLPRRQSGLALLLIGSALLGRLLVVL
jgi:hypothetical protein